MRDSRKHKKHRPGQKTERKRSVGGRVLGWDHVWVRRWQRFRLPPWLEASLKTFVRIGDGWGWLGMTLLLAVLFPRERFLFLAGQGLCAAALSIPLYWILKASFRRTRPHDLFKRIIPRVTPRDVYSFPSGHTMNNLAIGVSLAVHLPLLWPFALAVPLATGLLRVVFGVHFVSDIVAGTVFGLTTGLLAVYVYSWLPDFAFLAG